MNMEKDSYSAFTNEKFGLTEELISKYDVLFLPENVEDAKQKSELYDADNALDLFKILKEEGVNCANSYNLGLKKVPKQQNRSADIWLGNITIIGNVVLPLVLMQISKYLNDLCKQKKRQNSVKGDEKTRVVLKLRYGKNGKINKLDYDGDGSTLVKIIDRLSDD